jgi:hypothetical protein
VLVINSASAFCDLGECGAATCVFLHFFRVKCRDAIDQGRRKQN